MASTTTNYGLTKPVYSETADVAAMNTNMDKIDTALGGLDAGIAIVANGNTHEAISEGQYVYIRGHNSLAEGLYRATANIAANGTLSGSNVTSAVMGTALAALSGSTVKYTDVIDNLTSSETSKPLSAKQGKTLSDQIGKLNTPNVINDVNTAKDMGFYTTSSTSTNTPYAGYFTIYVYKYGNNDVTQFAVDINNNRMFTRTWHDGTTWTSWKEYVDGGEETVSSITFLNFTGTVSEIKCYRSGNVFTIAFKVAVETSTSGNAQINTASLPINGKTFKLAHGQWYDNTNDQSGEVSGYYGAGIRMTRAGALESFSSRINHSLSLVMTYLVA